MSLLLTGPPAAYLKVVSICRRLVSCDFTDEEADPETLVEQLTQGHTVGE